MRTLSTLLFVCLLTFTASAQETDTVVLKDGNTLTGTIKSMAGGKIVLAVGSLGDVTVPLANVENLQTAKAITLLTKQGERFERQITGLENGNLVLGGGADGAPAAPSLALDQLDKLNPPPKPEPKWTGSVNVGAFLTDGNTDRRAALAGATAVRRSDMDRITADVAWAYGEDKNNRVWTLSERRLTGGLKYDYFLSKKLYLYANTRATGDTLADLQLRFTAGTGLGYQVYEEADLKWGVEAGLAFVSENYRSMTPTDEYLAARLASNLEWVISDKYKLLNNIEYIPGLEDVNDAYAIKNTRLQVNLTDTMFAQLGWVLEYDNTPSPGLERMDNRYTLSVGWTF